MHVEGSSRRGCEWHTHVPVTLLRGMRDDVPLDDWLQKYIFPAEAKNVTEDFVRRGTRLAAAEQIRGGLTTFADMYFSRCHCRGDESSRDARGAWRNGARKPMPVADLNFLPLPATASV